MMTLIMHKNIGEPTAQIGTSVSQKQLPDAFECFYPTSSLSGTGLLRLLLPCFSGLQVEIFINFSKKKLQFSLRVKNNLKSLEEVLLFSF